MILKFVNALVGSVDETKTPLKRVQGISDMFSAFEIVSLMYVCVCCCWCCCGSVCFGDEAHFVITKIGMFFVVVEKKPQLEIEEPEESDAE